MSENQEQGPRSVGDMLRELRGQGVTVAELGRMLGRDPKVVRNVIAGKRSGEAYRQAVTELRERGTVAHPPARRRGADGHIVPVRAKDGRTVTPADAAARGRRAPRGKFTEQVTVLPGRARMVEVTAPKTRSAKGREKANGAFIGAIRRAAQGQRHDRKKVKFTEVKFSDGTVLPLGSKHGYQVSTVLAKGHAFAEDALGWLKTQAAKHGSGSRSLDRADVTITGVSMTIYNHADEQRF